MYAFFNLKLNKNKYISKYSFLFFIFLNLIFVGCTGKFEVDSRKPKLSASSVVQQDPALNSDSGVNSNSSSKIKIALNKSDLEFTEGSIALLSLELEEKSSIPVKIKLTAKSDEGNIFENRFVQFQNEVTVPAGSLSAPLLLTTKDDQIYQGTEKYTITLSSDNANVEIKNKNLNITIHDNDPQPKVQFEYLNYSFNETSGTNKIKVLLSEPSTRKISVLVSSSDGTAQKHSDYEFIDSQIDFNPGEIEKIISLNILQDDIVEGPEEFYLNLKLLSGDAQLFQSGVATIGIVDANQWLPHISVKGVNVSEDIGLAYLEVHLDQPSTNDVTFNWKTVAGTALESKDFKPKTEIGLVIPAGTTTKVISVEIVDDDIYEEEIESLSVQLFGVSGAIIGDNNAFINIKDNDNPPSVQFSLSQQEVSEGIGAVTVTLQASKPSFKIITVPLVFSGTCTEGLDYEVRNKTLQIPVGQTSVSFNIKIIDDSIVEDTEQIIISMGQPINANSGSNITQVISVKDNDSFTIVNYVASLIDSGSFTVGAQIPFKVVFSKVVNLDTTYGRPIVQMQTGTTGQGQAVAQSTISTTAALYVDGSGTNTLNFVYTVKQDDQTKALDYTNTAAFVLNGSTILDENKQKVITLLPTPGGTGSLSASKKILIDTQNPEPVAFITSPPWFNSLVETPVIEWPKATDGTDATSIVSYEFALGSTQGATDIQNWTSNGQLLNRQQTGFKFSEGQMIYPSVRAVDRALNRSTITNGNGWRIDSVPPTAPESIELENVQVASVPSGLNVKMNAIQVNWSKSSDVGSGISLYELSIGTKVNSTDIKSWTSVGNVLTSTVADLKLTTGSTYFVSVRAKDLAGNYSAEKNNHIMIVETKTQIQDKNNGISNITNNNIYANENTNANTNTNTNANANSKNPEYLNTINGKFMNAENTNNKDYNLDENDDDFINENEKNKSIDEEKRKYLNDEDNPREFDSSEENKMSGMQVDFR